MFPAAAYFRKVLLGAVVLFVCEFAAEAASLKISAGSATRQNATEVEGDYTTSHVYVNEVAGDLIPFTIFFDPQTGVVESAEVFTNLNRRDRAGLDADGDGIQDGIKPPSGDTVLSSGPTAEANYYRAHPMTPLGDGKFLLTLDAQKTGAYRLTARYRTSAAGPWIYYTGSFGDLAFRAHAVVVSPKAVRDIQLYEVNPLTITATGTLPTQRGTFPGLANGVAGGPRFSLQYVKDLGCNMLWFQPIHPNGISGRQLDSTSVPPNLPFEVGSPYAVKNFFEIMPLMASGFTPGGTPATNDTPAGRAQAMTEFQSFVAAADAGGVGVMLDAPFNHTSYDTELAALGQTLFGGASPTSEMRNTEARFFARSGAYDMRASSAANIAIAPDRIAEFAFEDTYEVFFGRYAALVSGSSGNHTNEGDWFDYSIGNEGTSGAGHFDAITQKVWRYFAEYTLHWLTQTGYPANAAGASLDSSAGVDALRADFGQGLPPQCWEYLINRTRTRKWNFVFMAESLDGGAVTYRSGRHFDILNENIVFPLHKAITVVQRETSPGSNVFIDGYREIFDKRRTSYGQALVLLNSSSHDEDHYNDPWEALIRYAVNSTIDGVPLIFPGQELGLSGTVIPPNDTNSSLTAFGYDRYETNFGKPIPHFKKYNSLMPLWLKTQAGHASYNYGLAQLAPVFSGIGQARKFSPALRSANRYFLNLTNTTHHGQIFSVAKFETRNAAPNFSDVVFGFVNIARNADPETTGGVQFDLNADVDGNGVNDFGLKPARTYNVKNIAAYLGVDGTRRDTFLIPGGRTGAQLLSTQANGGLYVKLNRVPTSDPAWATAPYEAQYLKLYDVTPPPNGGVPGTPKPYAIGAQVTFSWTAASDPEGGIGGYHVVISTLPNGAGTVLFDGNVTTAAKTVTAAFGQTLYATVRAVNNAGIESTTTSGSTGGTIALDPAADQDGDGQRNDSEDLSATNPLDGTSLFKIVQTTRLGASSVQLMWSSAPGKQYEVLATGDLGQPFVNISGPVPIPALAGATTDYTDNSASGGAKFYKVRLVP